jgi:hypothetical protein
MNTLNINIENSKLNNNGENKKLKNNIRQKLINKLQEQNYDVEVQNKKLIIIRNGAIIGTIEEVPKRKKRFIEPMYGNPYEENAGPGLDLKFVFNNIEERFLVEEIVNQILESENNNGDVPMNINNEYNGGRRKRSHKSKNSKTLKLKHSRRSLRRKTRKNVR